MTTRVAPYIRVSTDEQFKSGYSVPDQLRELRLEAERRGYQIVEEIIEPDGDSGYFRDRVGLQRIYELAESGAIDIVLAKKRDRLYRKRLYRLMAEEELAEFGVKLVALNDTGNRIGDGVQDDFAEYERETFIQRSRDGKRQKARGGKASGSGTPPYGFIYSDDRKSLEVDATMPVVRRIFEMAAGGDTLYKIAETFNLELVPAPRGRRWYPVSMQRMVFNEVYKGTWFYGKERAELTKGRTKSGNRRRKKSTNPQDEWIAVPVADSGVPHEIIDKARENLSKNYRPRAQAQHYYELKGLVYCDSCGLRMTTYTAGGYRYYICQRRRKFKPSDADYCNGALRTAETTTTRKRSVGLENEAMDYVQELIENPNKLGAQIDAAIANVQTTPDDSAAWFRVIEKCERDRAKDQQMFRDGLLSLDELRANLTNYDEQRKAAQEHIDASQGQQRRIDDLRATKRALLQSYATEIQYDGIRYLEPELRREIYEALQLSVIVGQDGTLRFRGVADAQVIRLTRAVERHGKVSYGRLGPGLSTSENTAMVMVEVAG